MIDQQTSAPNAQTNPLDLEQAKLALEREKLIVEREKLLVERYKAKWSAIGVGVPILVVAVTVILGVWSQYQKGRDDFALKAAEILLASDSPEATKNKAVALTSLFPTQLPPDFAKSFDPSQFALNAVPLQKELLQYMVAKPDDACRVLSIWKAMFPEDEWLGAFEKNLVSNPSFHRTCPKTRVGQ